MISAVSRSPFRNHLFIRRVPPLQHNEKAVKFLDSRALDQRYTFLNNLLIVLFYNHLIKERAKLPSNKPTCCLVIIYLLERKVILMEVS